MTIIRSYHISWLSYRLLNLISTVPLHVLRLSFTPSTERLEQTIGFNTGSIIHLAEKMELKPGRRLSRGRPVVCLSGHVGHDRLSDAIHPDILHLF